MDVIREAWRNQIYEAPLDPGLRIVDAHHHVVPSPHRERLEKYLYPDIVEDIARCGHNVVATVHVDAFSNYRSDGPEHLRAIGETEYIADLADNMAAGNDTTQGIFAAIVGNGDLMMGSAVGEVLDAQMAASVRLSGVRRMTIYDTAIGKGLPGNPQPGFMLTSKFHDGMQEVAKRGLTFDAGVAQSQLGEVLTLARAFPSVTIILGHLGTPLGVGRYADRPAEALQEWRDGMTVLATCPNVIVKIGGLNMPFTGLGAPDDAKMPWSSTEMAARQGDHVRLTIDLFGPERCMFESNFPVDKWYTSYGVLWNSFKRMSKGYDRAELHALFSGTACCVYQIRLPDTAGAASAALDRCPPRESAGT